MWRGSDTRKNKKENENNWNKEAGKTFVHNSFQTSTYIIVSWAWSTVQQVFSFKTFCIDAHYNFIHYHIKPIWSTVVIVVNNWMYCQSWITYAISASDITPIAHETENIVPIIVRYLMADISIHMINSAICSPWKKYIGYTIT